MFSNTNSTISSSTTGGPAQAQREPIDSAPPGHSQAQREPIDSAPPGLSQAQRERIDSAPPDTLLEQRNLMDSAQASTSQAQRSFPDSATPVSIDIDMSGDDVVVVTDGGDSDSDTPQAPSQVLENNPLSEGKTKPKRLSGAGRKRFWKLVDGGLSLDEALIQARQPFIGPHASRNPTGKQNLKRVRSEEESPKEKPKKTPKTSTTPEGRSNPPPSYKEVAGSVRVGIRNTEPMSRSQMNLVNVAISKAICQEGRRRPHAKTGGGPSFLNISHRPGWLLVTCENQASKEWLVGQVSRCKPWPEAQLSVVNEGDLPKPWIASVLVPYLEASSADDALYMISYQNEGLSAEHWRVVREVRQEDGFIAVFSLDDDSAETLRAHDCRASIGMRKLVFRVSGKQTPQESATATADAGSANAEPGPSGLGRGPAGRAQAPGQGTDSPVTRGTGGAPAAGPGPSGLGRGPTERNSAHSSGADSRGHRGTGGMSSAGGNNAFGPKPKHKGKGKKSRVPRDTPVERGQQAPQSLGGNARALQFIKRAK